MEGRVVVCGDFNAQCGSLKDADDDMNIVMGERDSCRMRHLSSKISFMI